MLERAMLVEGRLEFIEPAGGGVEVRLDVAAGTAAEL
jgi:hypothetical protein